MNKELTPAINELLAELWEELDDITRSQHILSNSELYQRVRLLQDTVAAFAAARDAGTMFRSWVSDDWYFAW